MNMIQHSEDIKAGIRHGFQDGTSKLAQRKCYGYEVSADGELVINEREAEVVRWIFEQYAEGKSLGKIADGLSRQGIPPPRPASSNGTERQSTSRCQMRSTPAGCCCKRQQAAGTIRDMKLDTSTTILMRRSSPIICSMRFKRSGSSGQGTLKRRLP